MHRQEEHCRIPGLIFAPKQCTIKEVLGEALLSAVCVLGLLEIWSSLRNVLLLTTERLKGHTYFLNPKLLQSHGAFLDSLELFFIVY